MAQISGIRRTILGIFVCAARSLDGILSVCSKSIATSVNQTQDPKARRLQDDTTLRVLGTH